MKNTPLLFLPLFFSSTLASFVVDAVTSTASTCEPVLLQWQGGHLGRWYVPFACVQISLVYVFQSIVDDNGNLIENLGTLKTTSFRWTVDVQAGTVVAARLIDSKGASATGKPFTVQSGSTNCTLRNGNTFIATPPPPQSTASTSDTSTSTSSSDTTSTESQPLQTTTSPGSVSLSGIAASASALSQIPSQSISQSSINRGTVTQSAVASPTQPPGSDYSPSSAAALTKSTTHHTALAFAIVLPCLALLAIACLWFICRRRRRRASDLEARPLPRRWFDKSVYHSGVTVSTDLSTEPDAHAVGAVVASRPTLPLLNTAAPPTRTGGITAASPPTGRPTPTPTTAFPGTARTPRTAFPESALTPATQLPSALTPATQPPSAMPYSQLDDSSKDVEVLRYRIQTLLAENAALADLVVPQSHADVPPPAVVSLDETLAETLGTFQNTSFYWIVDFAAGAVAAIHVTDFAGETAQSDDFTVQSGFSRRVYSIWLHLMVSAKHGVCACYLQHANRHDVYFLSEHNEFNNRIYIFADSFFQRYSHNHSNCFSVTSSSAVNSDAHRSPVGIIFAILIPGLFFLFVLGLACWCRRRPKVFFDLEAHPRPPLFDRSSYQGRASGSSGHHSTDLEGAHAVPTSILPPTFIPARPPTLQTIFSNSASSDNATTTPISPALSDSEIHLTFEALHDGVRRSGDPVVESQFLARVHALIAANAFLAELAKERPATP
ncbi:hypothetical protein B0H16DRAFT_1711787 [Mycena metata]|uniref:Uncharacterized protein n=1 Tax=Mycena metata TaxID=1033252 RepID=A0AAD7K4J1_9AGAR|nr:hypothetical protein B0H16DRAFT_1711787 [Mycena metata]